MKKILLGLLFLVAAISMFIFSVNVGSYPKLDTCLETSISKKLLCSKSPDYVKIDSVSEYFLKAVVMSEDDKFYMHDGFDWKELSKSMQANLRQFAFVRGGSTITQQLVKNVYLNRKKTISRKIIEARLAKRIENEHSKKLILEKYINAIEFGKDLWGIKRASNFYFKKAPSELNPLESLYLVILLPSPVKYSRTFFDKNLSSYQRKRMSDLLKRMRRRKMITTNQFEHLESELNSFLKVPGAGELVTEEEFSSDFENGDELISPEVEESSGADIKTNDRVEGVDNSLEGSQDDTVDDQEAEYIESEESYSEEDASLEDEDPDLDFKEDVVEEDQDQD